MNGAPQAVLPAKLSVCKGWNSELRCSVEGQADVVGGEVDMGGVGQVLGQVGDGVCVGGGVLGSKAQVGLRKYPNCQIKMSRQF